MKVFINFSEIISLEGSYNKDGRSLLPNDLSRIKNGAIVFDDKKIHWVGETKNLPSKYKDLDAKDMSGHVLTPEIVDSHTHLVFGGDRSFEYSMRLNGADYQDIAKSGGGILATMKATLDKSFDELFNEACLRVERIASFGIGTIEIKSGYALTYEKEKELSLIIDKLKRKYAPKIQIHNTFMAAHAIPRSFKSGKEYLEAVVTPLLKELSSEKIIDSVDIFQEEGYFSIEETENLFEFAQKLNIPVRIHADEFNDNKGAILASKYNALSADHLLCTTQDGIEALSKSNTVATILPGTAFFLGKPLANARGFLDAGCKVALASDYNPGSCHCDNLLLIASISAKNLGFNIAELWSAITLNSAHSLGLKNQGAIIPGLSPRFSIFNCDSVDKITYTWGRNFFVSF